MRGVDKNTGVLRSDNGVNHGGKVVDVGESLDAENDVIEGTVPGGRGVFRIAND